MEEMREIVDIRTVDAAIKIGAGVWFGACVLTGALLTAVRRRGPMDLVRGAFLAAIGPVVLGLWLLYSWMTRYDPETGYYGLDKVWVLAVNAALFVAVGGLYGWGLRRVWERGGARPQEATEPEGANGA